MQYVPLTVHLNALAQLYQQCATLSEKHDRLAKGLDIFNTEVPQLIIPTLIDQERVMQEQNTQAHQIQEYNSQKNNSPTPSQKSPVEITLGSDEDVAIEQGTKPIQSETKKIKKNKQNVDNYKFLQCSECHKQVKNLAGLKRHQTRMHTNKPLKNVTKKIQDNKPQKVQNSNLI
ncbi:unnamed protein product [Paramecium pentaurelia]|uniref:C2H2-type domain-containing protein n=1 Tax=Paramecium pentaurelia TaxID=43138 RepID=A0A8S1XIY3_9CILI|nr:unnamed protein product [Paramecium pentaurelia]